MTEGDCFQNGNYHTHGGDSPLRFYQKESRMRDTLKQRIDYSIKAIRRAARLAENYTHKPLLVAFSGGKDSQTLYHLTEMAGVPFESEYSATTIDPPELVRFIRANYPAVKFRTPKMSFWDLIRKKGALPTMIMRYCCAELKETQGAGRVVMTGVRRAESAKRSKRPLLTVNLKERQFDEFEREYETDVQCMGNGKEKIVVNPIIEWQEGDVWEFLNDVAKVPHCELYDKGYHRIGCLFCPMSSTTRKIQDAKRYPKQFEKLKAVLMEINPKNKYFKGDPEKHLRWWFSGESVAEFNSATLPLGEIPCELDLSFDKLVTKPSK